jgi:hypothetical protein
VNEKNGVRCGCYWKFVTVNTPGRPGVVICRSKKWNEMPISSLWVVWTVVKLLQGCVLKCERESTRKKSKPG